jgi:hypothetical protein
LWGVFCIFATIPFWELYGPMVRHGTRYGSPVRRKAGGGLDHADDDDDDDDAEHMICCHVRGYANPLITLANAMA